ncbi:hypothetical protein [Coprococcus comes]|uniref:hypothetical protein n=1 Tax=Coprococcus comes TaxID=410072 RepID=UPI00156FC64D|nr:hypothetical protein [Coprococcus comes]
MKIVSGRTGSPHVTSQQFRQMLEGIIGQGSYIITSGENLKPELSSNNLLKIRSGMMAHHGCISCVDIGTYDEVTLTNGSQGMKRIDLIVNRYTRNAETEVENCSWKVIQGKPVASNPAVPAYTSGNLQNGDLVDECPAFEVHYDGINVTEVKSLLSVTDGLSGLSSNLVNAKNKLTALSDSINNLGSTKTVKLANKSSSNGVATYTDYVTLPSAGSYVIYCNATMSGTPTSGVSNLGIQVNSVDGTGGFHSVGSCSHNGFAIDLNGFYVLTTKVSNEKIRLRLYQNGGYAETWKNISVYYKKIL